MRVEFKMDTISWYVLSGIVIVALIVAIIWFIRPRPRCPECISHDVSLIKKEPQKMNVYEHPTTGGGESGGAHFTTSVFYRVSFRCNDCQETWEKDITESR